MADRSYNHVAALVIGFLQILVAIACIAIQAMMYTENLFIAPSAAGLWAGIFFFICGVLEVISWKVNSQAMIVSVMVMSILSCLVAAAAFCVLGITWLIGSVATGGARNSGEYSSNDKLTNDLTLAHIILFACEGILAITASVFCCVGMCGQNSASSPMQVVYVTTTTGQLQQTLVCVPPTAGTSVGAGTHFPQKEEASYGHPVTLNTSTQGSSAGGENNPAYWSHEPPPYTPRADESNAY